MKFVRKGKMLFRRSNSYRNASYKHRSFWLQEIAGDAPDAPALQGAIKTDVAIAGGGYVGLWTAIRIKELMPACDVTVIEQDICGGGASGRNGGFVLSWIPKLSTFSALFGVQDALRMAKDSVAAIGELADFASLHGIDADFRKGGWLWTATSKAQLGAWESLVQLCERNGLCAFQRLEPQEVAARSGSSAHRAGVYASEAAIVQPATLARGLRRVALELGVRIFEHTSVKEFTRASPVRIDTECGTVTANKLVIATNAWAASVRELSRAITVISSDMVVTERIAPQLQEIGWRKDLSITDSQTMVDYYRITRDGRVAFGKGGWTIALGGNIGSDFDRQSMRAAEVVADFRRYYPLLESVAITHDWSGPIDRTPDSLPLIGYLGGRKDICYGIGWSGNGVGPSVIGGRVLASLALERDNHWSQYPLVGRKAKNFPPEPVRFIGAHLVRAAVASKEKAEIDDRKPSALAVRVSRFAPAGLEDK
jgi:putative aminophosphonate oxidoreductase